MRSGLSAVVLISPRSRVPSLSVILPSRESARWRSIKGETWAVVGNDVEGAVVGCDKIQSIVASVGFVVGSSAPHLDVGHRDTGITDNKRRNKRRFFLPIPSLLLSLCSPCLCGISHRAYHDVNCAQIAATIVAWQ